VYITTVNIMQTYGVQDTPQYILQWKLMFDYL